MGAQDGFARLASIVSLRLTNAETIEVALSRLVEVLAPAFPAWRISIDSIEFGKVRLEAAWGVESMLAAGTEFPATLTHDLFQTVVSVRAGRITRVDLYDIDFGLYGETLLSEGVLSAVWVPLHREGEVANALWIGSPSVGGFNQTTDEFFCVLGAGIEEQVAALVQARQQRRTSPF